MVAECSSEHGWDIGLRRSLSHHDLPQWQETMIQLQGSLSHHDLPQWQEPMIQLQGIHLQKNANDEVKWDMDKSKSLSTKSLYMFLTDGGVCSRTALSIWKFKVPMKIKVFLWQLFNNKLQAAAILKRRGCYLKEERLSYVASKKDRWKSTVQDLNFIAFLKAEETCFQKKKTYGFGIPHRVSALSINLYPGGHHYYRHWA